MLKEHIIDFNENLIGLREFVELIDPFLQEKAKEHTKEIELLSVLAMFEKIVKESKDLTSENSEFFSEMKKTISANVKNKYAEIPEVTLVKNTNTNKANSHLLRITTSNDTILSQVRNVNKTTKHINLLYTNCLISVLSSVEWYFSQILHLYYNRHPESAGVQKKTLTLSELKTFGSIEDAEKHLINTKIDAILRGNFQSWIDLMKTELKLGLSYINDIEDELIEIYQRRNLFVHNGGVVNSIYLSKVAKKYRVNITNGERLVVTEEYLENTICKLQKAFILIGAELWKKLKPNDFERGDVITNIVYDNLLHSRWEICEGLCYFTLKDFSMKPVDKTIAQINFWLCQKEMGKYSSIQKEIDKADFSDKKEIFQLALYALRNETKEIVRILPIILETKQIDIESIEEFPVLREFRETKEYETFKQESVFFKDDNKIVEMPKPAIEE